MFGSTVHKKFLNRCESRWLQMEHDTFWCCCSGLFAAQPVVAGSWFHLGSGCLAHFILGSSAFSQSIFRPCPNLLISNGWGREAVLSSPSMFEAPAVKVGSHTLCTLSDKTLALSQSSRSCVLNRDRRCEHGLRRH